MSRPPAGDHQTTSHGRRTYEREGAGGDGAGLAEVLLVLVLLLLLLVPLVLALAGGHHLGPTPKLMAGCL